MSGLLAKARERRAQFDVKVGQYLMAKHEGAFHRWLKEILRRLNIAQYPKGALSFLDSEMGPDDH